ARSRRRRKPRASDASAEARQNILHPPRPGSPPTATLPTPPARPPGPGRLPATAAPARLRRSFVKLARWLLRLQEQNADQLDALGRTHRLLEGKSRQLREQRRFRQCCPALRDSQFAGG